MFLRNFSPKNARLKFFSNTQPAHLNTESYFFVLMGTQISIKLSGKMLVTAKNYAKGHGYDNLQDFIRELLREKLFENEGVSGLYTYKASEASLAKNWLRKEEDEAWAHLQKET